jgi:hypothetical protein
MIEIPIIILGKKMPALYYIYLALLKDKGQRWQTLR